MTNTITQNEERHVADVLAKILDGEQQFFSEKRSDDRELLLVPAQVFQAEFDFELSGFTRDVSAQGVCLIMPQPFRQGAIAQLSLFGQSSEESRLATCCWNAKFVDTYWVSGWRLDQAIPVVQLLQEDGLLEPDQRVGDRLQAAVPVSICLTGNTSHVSGFTRNISTEGISLVSKVETQLGQEAELVVIGHAGESSRIKSRCLWVKHYGGDNWVSGWTFKV